MYCRWAPGHLAGLLPLQLCLLCLIVFSLLIRVELFFSLSLFYMVHLVPICLEEAGAGWLIECLAQGSKK